MAQGSLDLIQKSHDSFKIFNKSLGSLTGIESELIDLVSLFCCIIYQILFKNTIIINFKTLN